MQTVKLIATAVCVACIVFAALIRDFFLNPRRFIREMREVNDE